MCCAVLCAENIGLTSLPSPPPPLSPFPTSSSPLLLPIQHPHTTHKGKELMAANNLFNASAPSSSQGSQGMKRISLGNNPPPTPFSPGVGMDALTGTGVVPGSGATADDTEASRQVNSK